MMIERPDIEGLEVAAKTIDGYLYDRRDTDGRVVADRAYRDAREFVDDAMPDLLAYIHALEAKNSALTEALDRVIDAYFDAEMPADAPTSPVGASQPTAVAEDAQGQLGSGYWVDKDGYL